MDAMHEMPGAVGLRLKRDCDDMRNYLGTKVLLSVKVTIIAAQTVLYTVIDSEDSHPTINISGTADSLEYTLGLGLCWDATVERHFFQLEC